ncbi:MAG: SpoIID/LytB domain-containing protein [Gemmatimonadota bacterium]|nr:SpoIID/LytB domain-containing protein [Gemmatimonadota bacterium]
MRATGIALSVSCRAWLHRARRGGFKAFGLLGVAAVACSAAAATRGTGASPAHATTARDRRGASARSVRVALSENVEQVRLTSAGAWQLYAEDGRTAVALTQPGERWVLEREGGVVRARREDSRPVTGRERTVIARPLDSDGQITLGARRYRGELLITATPQGLTVVNRLNMDDYVKGVVPLEIGTSAAADAAAVEAQAVTARSYAFTHLESGNRLFDLRATVADQVYGGAGVETRVGNVAVEGTSGLVLLYGGQVVNAPYFSTCGGSTAEPQDVWRTGAEPYLKRVSDQIPGTSRFYCDGAPKFRWTRTYSREALRETVARYVAGLSNGGSVSSVKSVRVTDVTPAGRVATLEIATDRRTLSLHGNEMRSALRLPGGEILYSTYFSVDAVTGRDGVESLTLNGGGNGHGVGMCQAGAIGRARAGQDFRTILRTYYPGTIVGTIE